MRTLPILISRQGVEHHGRAIETCIRATSGASVEPQWIFPDAPPPANGPWPSEVAFLTRDVTGSSTKTDLKAPLLAFYEALRSSPGLKWIHTHSSGADRPIYKELGQQGVRVSTSSGANAAPVAHTAIAAVLALGRRFPELMQAQSERRWSPLLNHPALHDLTGQTVMIVGQGPIGTRIGHGLMGLGFKVLGVTRHVDTARQADSAWPLYELTQFRACLSQVNFLLLACPLTAQTQGLIDQQVLQVLPAGACIVNVARGEVVRQDALLSALKTGHLGGAFLDVFEQEPLPTVSELWSLPNVMISPHTAGHFSGYAEKVLQLFLDNMTRYLNRQPLLNEVDARKAQVTQTRDSPQKDTT